MPVSNSFVAQMQYTGEQKKCKTDNLLVAAYSS